MEIIIDSVAHLFSNGYPCVPQKSHNIMLKLSDCLEISVISNVFVHDFPKSFYGI
jgi:hypothetical protein